MYNNLLTGILASNLSVPHGSVRMSFEKAYVMPAFTLKIFVSQLPAGSILNSSMALRLKKTLVPFYEILRKWGSCSIDLEFF